MDVTLVLELVKESLGIRTTIRDGYLTQIIKGIINELEDEKGLLLDGNTPSHLIFVVDLATWRYKSRDEAKAMPRDLQFRLHNMIIHVGGKRNE